MGQRISLVLRAASFPASARWAGLGSFASRYGHFSASSFRPESINAKAGVQPLPHAHRAEHQRHELDGERKKATMKPTSSAKACYVGFRAAPCRGTCSCPNFSPVRPARAGMPAPAPPRRHVAGLAPLVAAARGLVMIRRHGPVHHLGLQARSARALSSSPGRRYRGRTRSRISAREHENRGSCGRSSSALLLPDDGTAWHGISWSRSLFGLVDLATMCVLPSARCQVMDRKDFKKKWHRPAPVQPSGWSMLRAPQSCRRVEDESRSPLHPSTVLARQNSEKLDLAS